MLSLQVMSESCNTWVNAIRTTTEESPSIVQEKADDGIPSALAQLRQLVATSLAAPAALVGEAAAAAEAAGLVEAGQWTPESAAWSDAWSAIRQASASILNAQNLQVLCGSAH